MQRLADISLFESLQATANARMMGGMSIFNANVEDVQASVQEYMAQIDALRQVGADAEAEAPAPCPSRGLAVITALPFVYHQTADSGGDNSQRRYDAATLLSHENPPLRVDYINPIRRLRCRRDMVNLFLVREAVLIDAVIFVGFIAGIIVVLDVHAVVVIVHSPLLLGFQDFEVIRHAADNRYADKQKDEHSRVAALFGGWLFRCFRVVFRVGGCIPARSVGYTAHGRTGGLVRTRPALGLRQSHQVPLGHSVQQIYVVLRP